MRAPNINDETSAPSKRPSPAVARWRNPVVMRHPLTGALVAVDTTAEADTAGVVLTTSAKDAELLAMRLLAWRNREYAPRSNIVFVDKKANGE
eukprot:876684-Prorocentrum_minimum.AAC.2